MTTLTEPTAPSPKAGLRALDSVVLSPEHQRKLDEAAAAALGTPVWKARKTAEARSLLAMSQLAPRMHVEHVDLQEALRAVVHLRMPVPCRPDDKGELVVADHVVLGLTYHQDYLRLPQHGYAYVTVLWPWFVWHPNIGQPHPIFGQPLCLGTYLPAGIRAKELVLMTYGALCLQNVQIDEFDTAGVMNVEAARWWQQPQNLARIPLSRVPFLSTEDLEKRS